MTVSPIYSVSSENGQLRQGEIISNLVQVKIKLESIGSEDGYDGSDVIHEFCIVVTQDCDLEQDYAVRFRGGEGEHRILPNVLFCEVHTAERIRYKSSPDINSKIWPIVRQNRDERYHFLENVSLEFDSLGQGLPEMGIEFKRYFAVPTDEVYHRISTGEAKRRCKLESPYMEHFSTRFHYYHYRVALPEPHSSS